jgi:flagellar export protein FliJ
VPFHFTLAPLLRLRESLEKAELQRLQMIAMQVAQVKVEIESLDREIEAARRQLLEQTATGISGAELNMAALLEAARREQRRRLVAKLDVLEQARRKQQSRYTEVRQQREIVSNLRKRQLSAYQREQARHDQQQVDEFFLIRRGGRSRL